MPLDFSDLMTQEINQREEAARVYHDKKPAWGDSEIFGEVVYKPTLKERILLLLGAPCYFRWKVCTQFFPGAVQVGSEANMVAVMREEMIDKAKAEELKQMLTWTPPK